MLRFPGRGRQRPITECLGELRLEGAGSRRATAPTANREPRRESSTTPLTNGKGAAVAKVPDPVAAGCRWPRVGDPRAKGNFEEEFAGVSGHGGYSDYLATGEDKKLVSSGYRMFKGLGRGAPSMFQELSVGRLESTR